MTENAPGKATPKVPPSSLANMGLFGGLSDEVLELLAQELTTCHAEAGEMVVREGERATEMYVVVGGELEVVKRASSNGDVRVALFGPGDWFGEMAIVDVQPRSASVRAVAPTLLLKITAEDVNRLLYRRDLKAYAMFVMNIARELSRRLRVVDGILAQFVTNVADTYQRRP